jgi:hypothetical protein
VHRQLLVGLERGVHLLRGERDHHDHGQDDRQQREVEAVGRRAQQLAVKARGGLGRAAVGGWHHGRFSGLYRAWMAGLVTRPWIAAPADNGKARMPPASRRAARIPL